MRAKLTQSSVGSYETDTVQQQWEWYYCGSRQASDSESDEFQERTEDSALVQDGTVQHIEGNMEGC